MEQPNEFREVLNIFVTVQTMTAAKKKARGKALKAMVPKKLAP